MFDNFFNYIFYITTLFQVYFNVYFYVNSSFLKLKYREKIISKMYKDRQSNNIIVSLTTIPSRSNDLKFTIMSLLLQSKLPKKIYITIPEKCSREANLNFNIDYLKIFGNIIEIVDINYDYGPICKLWAGFNKVNHDDKDTLIITVDDDTIYNYDLIENLVKHSEKESVICTIGRTGYTKVYGYSDTTPQLINSIEGYGGVMYKRKYLSDELFCMNQKKIFKFNDDLMIDLTAL